MGSADPAEEAGGLGGGMDGASASGLPKGCEA